LGFGHGRPPFRPTKTHADSRAKNAVAELLGSPGLDADFVEALEQQQADNLPVQEREAL
jgi:hypothetical protein